MKYAIIQLQGKQFQVSEGDQITVDRLDKTEGEKFAVTDVLLLVDEDKKKIGQPIVKDVKVNCEVLSNDKGKKIRVAKYKAKSRYRKVMGHRQLQSVLKIVSIV
jgi:large subunit ribosomal protein L21